MPLCQLHTNSRILLIANSLSFVAYSPQNPPVLLPMLIREALLRNRKQRIEISFLCNQLIERACFNNGTVLQCDNAIVLF